jgi:hypothetical protein
MVTAAAAADGDDDDDVFCMLTAYETQLMRFLRILPQAVVTLVC